MVKLAYASKKNGEDISLQNYKNVFKNNSIVFFIQKLELSEERVRSSMHTPQ